VNYIRATDSQIYPTAKIVNTTNDPAKFRIGKKCIIGDFVFIALKRLRMGFGSQIAPHAMLSGGGEVIMEPFSVIGFGSHLITGTDTTRGKYMCEAASKEFRNVIRGSITLKKGAYIGSNAMICVCEEYPDIVIGENSVVGAFSYIDKDIPPNIIVYPKQELVFKPREWQ